MSVFSAAEIAYLQSNTMGRLATIGSDGRRHLVPLTYRFNADEDAIDIGGVDFPNTKKWRDMLQNPHVVFLVDDASLAGAHAIEIRGDAEPHSSGGELINPRFPTSSRSSSEYDRTALSAGESKMKVSCPTPARCVDSNA
jgi:pyridoxamine 5'-phosphate oxidase family protein